LQEQGEPGPKQVKPETKMLLRQLEEQARVQTFGWRLLQKAMPTGARAGKYSKHVSKLCCRCGSEENDKHLFFTCNFARASWFCETWFIRTDIITVNLNSITEIIIKLLNTNHQNATLTNILTFMWCLWKSRNDCLFNRKETHPKQIHHMANAVTKSLEMVDVVQVPNSYRLQNEDPTKEKTSEQGETIRTDLAIIGNKIFSDAAWKNKSATGSEDQNQIGIGVYYQALQHNIGATILIQASTTQTPSPLQAEAAALNLAARIASHLQISQVSFLTDNLALARAAASKRASDPHIPWEIREQIAIFKNTTRNIEQEVYHIKRDFNNIAHSCAQQAIRQVQSRPIISCSNSAHQNCRCPVILAFQKISSQGLALQVVNVYELNKIWRPWRLLVFKKKSNKQKPTKVYIADYYMLKPPPITKFASRETKQKSTSHRPLDTHLVYGTQHTSHRPLDTHLATDN
jgi:hypothetical protein